MSCRTLFRLERLAGEEGAERAIRLARRVSFLPKRRWSRNHVAMLANGLACGKWEGLALVDDGDGRIVSYVDYKSGPSAIEIGFCMTDPDYRRLGLSSRLVGILVATNLRRDFKISTYGANVAMASVLQPLSFEVTERVANDRIDGDETIYLCRRADVPIDLSGWLAQCR